MSYLLTLLVLPLLASTMEEKENARQYLQLCPNQNRSLPCDPSNLDSFMSSGLQSIRDLKNILSKAFIPGRCYSPNKKYCPANLYSCLSVSNLGFNWTVEGLCLLRDQECPQVFIEEVCEDIKCPEGQFLCHPQGCIPHISHCNGACPNFPSLSSRFETQTTETHTRQSKSDRKPKEKFQRRSLCGNSCLTREEARNKYDCNGKCQVKSEPCRVDDTKFCPQHYSLCGIDTCVDRFLQEKSIASTGQPEYYSCQGVCTHSSLPCFSSLNRSLLCLTGYWLCEDMAQCVLLGKLSVEDNHYSSLCDGKIDCKDGSDEGSYQCLQVYFYEAVTYFGLTVSFISITLCSLCSYRSILSKIFTRHKHIEEKTYHRNEGFTDYFPSSPASHLSSACHTPPAPPPPSPAIVSLVSESLPLIPTAPPLTPKPPSPPYPRFVFTYHPPESYQPIECTSLKF